MIERTALLTLLALALCIPASHACEIPRDSEPRYSSTPSKPESRRGSVLVAFKRLHPCPSTGKREGPCEGWVMDHVIPLACGGADAVANLQYLPTAMWREKSRWERKIYLRAGNKPTLYCKAERVGTLPAR